MQVTDAARLLALAIAQADPLAFDASSRGGGTTSVRAQDQDDKARPGWTVAHLPANAARSNQREELHQFCRAPAPPHCAQTVSHSRSSAGPAA